jgi:hypothetical protein
VVDNRIEPGFKVISFLCTAVSVFLPVDQPLAGTVRQHSHRVSDDVRSPALEPPGLKRCHAEGPLDGNRDVRTHLDIMMAFAQLMNVFDRKRIITDLLVVQGRYVRSCQMWPFHAT